MNNKRILSFSIVLLLSILVVLTTGCRKKRITERIDYIKKPVAQSDVEEKVSGFPAQAEEYLKNQDYENLYKLIRNELKKSKGDSLVYSYLGVYYNFKKKSLKATKAFEKALKMNPYNELAKEQLSKLFFNEANLRVDEIEDPVVFNSIIFDLKKACQINPANKAATKLLSEMLYRKGESLFKQDELKGSQEYLRKSLEYNNSNYNSVITLSQIHLKEKGKQGLYRFLNSIKTKYPTNQAPDVIMNEIKYDEDKLDSGEEFFNEMRVKKDYTFDNFEQIKSTNLYEKGTYYLGKKKWSKAVDYFSRALTVNPGNSREIYFYLAKAYFSLGFISKARYYLDELKKHGDLNLEQKLLEIDIEIKKKKYDESLNKLNQLKASFPENELIQTKIFEIQLKKGAYRQVIEELNKILATSPNNADALELMGLAYAKQRNFDRALPYWERLLIVEPDNAKTYYNKGIVYVKRRNFMEAIINFSLASRFEPENPLYLYSLGLTFRQNGMMNESTEVWTELIKKFPSSKYANKVNRIIKSDSGSVDMFSKVKGASFSDANKIFQEGFISLRIGDYVKAKERFEKVLKINPENIKSNKAMSELMGKIGNWVEEVSYALKAIQLDKKIKGVHKYIGHGYIYLGLVSDAKPFLTQAISHNDMDWEALKMMACAHLLEGEEELAEKYISRIQQIYGNSSLSEREITSIREAVKTITIPQEREEITIRKKLIKKFLELEIYENLLFEVRRVENLYTEYFRKLEGETEPVAVVGSYEDFSEKLMTKEVEPVVEEKIYDLDIFHYKIEALYNLEKFQDIITHAARNKSVFDNSLEMRYYLAESFLKGEMLDQSKELFESVFKQLKQRNEFYARVARGIGIIAELNDDVKTAIQYFKKAIPFLKDEEKAEIRIRLEGLKNKFAKKK
ncbi:tetratricopeptide repeat protein [bacterium]|nr:tetratricopeptide repeat protein [bacterium]